MKTKVLAINPTLQVHERMEALIARSGGHLSKRALAMLALQHGLDIYERALNNVDAIFDKSLTPAEESPVKKMPGEVWPSGDLYGEFFRTIPPAPDTPR